METSSFCNVMTYPEEAMARGGFGFAWGTLPPKENKVGELASPTLYRADGRTNLPSLHWEHEKASLDMPFR